MSKTNHRRKGDTPRKDSDRYKGGQHDYINKVSELTGTSYQNVNDEHGRKPGREGSRRGKRAAKRDVNQVVRRRDNQETRRLADDT